MIRRTALVVWISSLFAPALFAQNLTMDKTTGICASAALGPDEPSTTAWDKPDKPGGWATAGVGACHFGTATNVSVSYGFDNNIVTARYIRTEEFLFSASDPIEVDPEMSFKEIGVLYGRAFKKEFLVLSMAAGVSSLSGVDRGKQIDYRRNERIDISGIGMPFEAKFRFELGVIGIGGSWFGNLNGKRSFSGGLIEIHFGVFPH